MKRFRSRFRSKKRTGVSDSTNAKQKQQLKEGTDATKRLDRNDASNEGIKRSNAPLLNENTPIRELWKVAYEKLREEDGTLIESYETEFNKSVAAGLMQHLPFLTNKRDLMDAILRIKMDEININASSPEFKAKAGEFIQLFMKVVDSANDYISNAASANPYTSIAWTGVSLVLPVGSDQIIIGSLSTCTYSIIALAESFRAEGSSSQRARLYYVFNHSKSNARRTLYRVL